MVFAHTGSFFPRFLSFHCDKNMEMRQVASGASLFVAADRNRSS
jgi:hypothetical protein